MKISISVVFLGSSLLLALVASEASAGDRTSYGWCEDVTLTGKLVKGEFKNDADHSVNPFHVITMASPLNVATTAADCAYDTVDTSEVQISGNTKDLESRAGQNITVTGRLLPASAPADRRDVILFVPQ